MLSKDEIRAIVTDFFEGFYEIEISDELKKRLVTVAFTGNINIKDNIIKVTIGFQEKFPLNKPLFFINPFDALGFIPHIDPDGYVCYVQDDNLILDKENPQGIIEESFDRAEKTLSDGFQGLNKKDFLNEFEYYWERLAEDSKSYYCTVQPSDSTKQIVVGIHKGIRFICDDSNDIKLLKERFGLRTPGRIIPGLYIPLKLNAIEKPPKYGEFWSPQYLKSLIGDSVAIDELEKLIKNLKQKDEYLILGIQSASGQVQLVGIRMRKNSVYKHHPLLPASGIDFTLHPFSLERLNKSTILPRGGSDTSLLEKKVLLVGCGALGGHIALNLAKSGIGKLTLCDPDILKRENIYRHVLGLRNLNSYKAEGLKELIENQLPYVEVTSVVSRIENFTIEKLSGFDLIMFATGNPTVNLHFNQEIRESGSSMISMYSWIEPYGIGGHTLVSNPKSKGCYNCIYDEKLWNRASFCSSSQPKSFTKSVSGCGGLFVPFGYLDAVKTAQIASNLSIEILHDTTIPSQVISWKGNSNEFLKEGFNLSERYLNQDSETLFKNRFKFKRDDCHLCAHQ